ncbi:MAG: hypothetical protein K0Q91_2019 [Fibrobacteria bacterium]|nr:hypothetical protein [Fibrobacteria bacterium]
MQKASLKNLVLGLAALGALVLGGCLNDAAAPSPSPLQDANLSISLSVPDVNKSNSLKKGSTISYAKLIVTLTSSVGSDSVIRDTITPGENGFTSVATANQSVAKSYSVKPLRGWTVAVKTLDLNDSVIHSASVLADSIRIGEFRPVTLSLTSRFVMYVAKFTLPDSIGSATGTFREKLNIDRFMLVLDGDTVRDTTKQGGGYFASAPTFHTVGFDYVRADTSHVLKLYVFGTMNNWPVNKPLYGDSVVISTTDTLKTPTLAYVGPGSPTDTVGGPSNGAQISPLTIEIGKVGIVEINPILPENPLPKNKQ